MATQGLNLEEQKAVDRFRKAVVEPSMTKLVILDFWAEWCEPCKQLAPVLESVAAEYAAKGVVLEKVNVDEERFIASQFQVRSIPTVYALFQGQPVADLTSARTAGQLRQTLDQLLAQLPIEAGASDAEDGQAAQIEQFIAMGEQILADGDGQRAAGIFAQVAEMQPANAAAHAGLIRALLAADREEEARAHYDGLPEDLRSETQVAQAAAALDLAATRVDDGELAAMREAASDPDAMDARLAYAEAAFAAGQRDAAADELLAMIERDREWNEGAARAKLLQIFEAVGLEDQWTVATRRRLSRLLFG